MSELNARTHETPEETEELFLLEHRGERTMEDWQRYFEVREAARANGKTVWISDGKNSPRYTLYEGLREAFFIEQGLEGWGVYTPDPEKGLDVLKHAANVTLGQAIQAVEAIIPPTFSLFPIRLR